MEKRKGSLLQGMRAVLLSAVLVVCMVSNAAPASVLAQEPGETQGGVSGSLAEISKGDIMSDEGADSEGQETLEPGMEEETEPGIVIGNDAKPEPVAEPQSMMMAAEPALQADSIASGDGWMLAADGTLTIQSSRGMDDWWQKRATYNALVTSIEIQDGVTRITSDAFEYCSELTSVTLPDTLETIGHEAFRGCSKLTSITLPEHLKEILNASFSGCSGLTSITLPDSLTTIGHWSFNECSGLTSMTIPAGVTNIRQAAFVDCTGLTEVIMESETPPQIGNDVFKSCKFVSDNKQGIHVPNGKAQAYKDAWPDWAAYITDGTAPAESHTHNLTLMPEKPATCTENGTKAYYACDGCDQWFMDAAGTQEITNKDSVVISKTGHDYDETAWGYQTAGGHAHNCRKCDAHDTIQPHTPGAAATAEAPQTCTVCGYIIAPATGTEPESGTVTPQVKPGVNAPATVISTPTEELKGMLLTDEERQQVQNGTNIRIVLEVQDAGNTVNGSDKESIRQEYHRDGEKDKNRHCRAGQPEKYEQQ